MKTYILIQAAPGAPGTLIRDVSDIPGVLGVDPVAGPFDLIAEAELPVTGPDGVLPTILGLEGVLRALTSPVVESEIEAPAA